MKKATLTLTFEKEKLNALEFYMEKKDAELQNELSDIVQKLYEKYVPQPTREYIEDRIAKETKPTKAKKPITTSQSNNDNS
ncbi:DUF6103 family protein [Inediibacterium massiliense]|uniref:DUF6103 family protein n=1 Tax=Inediibacterium massiliense TaxID=1658111 RepID=UPI0006B52DC0|nr:DUF6103 family protein [Inediibacterium massiliense]